MHIAGQPATWILGSHIIVLNHLPAGLYQIISPAVTAPSGTCTGFLGPHVTHAPAAAATAAERTRALSSHSATDVSAGVFGYSHFRLELATLGGPHLGGSERTVF